MERKRRLREADDGLEQKRYNCMCNWKETLGGRRASGAQRGAVASCLPAKVVSRALALRCLMEAYKRDRYSSSTNRTTTSTTSRDNTKRSRSSANSTNTSISSIISTSNKQSASVKNQHHHHQQPALRATSTTIGESTEERMASPTCSSCTCFIVSARRFSVSSDSTARFVASQGQDEQRAASGCQYRFTSNRLAGATRRSLGGASLGGA